MAGFCVSGLLAGLVAGGLGRLGAPPCCFASGGGFTGLALPNDCPALDWPAFDRPNFDFATSALAVLELTAFELRDFGGFFLADMVRMVPREKARSLPNARDGRWLRGRRDYRACPGLE